MDEINDKLDIVEETISKPEDIAIESIQIKHREKKRERGALAQIHTV